MPVEKFIATHMDAKRPKSHGTPTEADLERIPLLRACAPDARAALLKGGRLHDFAAGQTLWRAGEDARGLFFIRDGCVRVVRERGARRHVIHEEAAGGTLGDIPFFHGGAYPATAFAVSRTTCLAFDRATIGAAFSADPDLAFALLARLAGRIREIIERLDGVAVRSVRSRLAAYLLTRGARAATPTFSLGATQAQVAEELGTVREVIVRTLRALCDEGVIIAAGNGRYRIVASDRLLQIAEDLPG